MKHQRLFASILCISLLASLSGCGKKSETVSEISASSEAVQIQESDAANSIQMEGTEGVVTVTDDQGKDHTPEKDMNLYVDYSVETEEESLAWMEADETKLYAMGPSSDIAVEETGRNMKMRVNEGTFFFAYTEPLNEDESAEFYTNLTSMSIRGTCGIIQAISDTETEIQILEGNVEVQALDEEGKKIKTESVVTGQQIVVQKDAEGNVTTTVEHINLTEIPTYVYDEIQKNDEVKTLIEEKTGDEYFDYIKKLSDNESETETVSGSDLSTSSSEQIAEEASTIQSTADTIQTHDAETLAQAKAKYYEFLSGLYTSGEYNSESRFRFVFIDADDIPELAVVHDFNGATSMYIYTYDNGNIINCGSAGYVGYLDFVKQNNIMLDSFAHTGYIIDTYWIINETSKSLETVAGKETSVKEQSVLSYSIEGSETDAEGFVSYITEHFPGVKMSIQDGKTQDDTEWDNTNLSEGNAFTPEEIDTAVNQAFETINE